MLKTNAPKSLMKSVAYKAVNRSCHGTLKHKPGKVTCNLLFPNNLVQVSGLCPRVCYTISHAEQVVNFLCPNYLCMVQQAYSSENKMDVEQDCKICIVCYNYGE